MHEYDTSVVYLITKRLSSNTSVGVQCTAVHVQE
jgi:hypothetical protein